MASVVVPVDVDVSLVDRISKIEESLKELKRAARQELKARRRRRGTKVGAELLCGDCHEKRPVPHTEAHQEDETVVGIGAPAVGTEEIDADAGQAEEQEAKDDLLTGA